MCNNHLCSTTIIGLLPGSRAWYHRDSRYEWIDSCRHAAPRKAETHKCCKIHVLPLGRIHTTLRHLQYQCRFLYIASLPRSDRLIFGIDCNDNNKQGAEDRSRDIGLFRTDNSPSFSAQRSSQRILDIHPIRYRIANTVIQT